MATHKDPRVQSIIDAMSASMDDTGIANSLLAVYQAQVEATGDGSFARFTQALTQISRDIVQPAAKAYRAANPQSRGSNVDNSWRSEQKALFSGRGRQWIKLTIDQISSTLDEFKANGFDTESYESWINAAGYAWVRYNGPRLNDGEASASFEVRLNGSKTDSPSTLFYMSNEDVMNISDDNRLPNTPYGLRLEEAVKIDTTPDVTTDDEEIEINTSDVEYVELSELDN